MLLSYRESPNGYLLSFTAADGRSKGIWLKTKAEADLLLYYGSLFIAMNSGGGQGRRGHFKPQLTDPSQPVVSPGVIVGSFSHDSLQDLNGGARSAAESDGVSSTRIKVGLRVVVGGLVASTKD